MEPDFQWDYRKVNRVLNQVNGALERLLWAMDRAETLMRRGGRLSPEAWFRNLPPFAAEAPQPELNPELRPVRSAVVHRPSRSGRTANARRAGARRRSGFTRQKRK